MKVSPPDLRVSFPRSPKEELGSYVHLARMIDKARAQAAGTLGDYLYPCPLDQRLLEFLGVISEDFLDAIRDRDDTEVLEWIKQNALPKTTGETKEWTRSFLNRGPHDEESWEYFKSVRVRFAPGRSDISTWVDLLDLEEGR